MHDLLVTSIQRGAVYDGSGVRTTVFLHGCSLRCPWCCNPETQAQQSPVFYHWEKCLYKQGITSRLCSDCKIRGGCKSPLQCPIGVAVHCVKSYSEETLWNEIIKDASLFQLGGGVTFSGGEPLLQAKALEPLCKRLMNANICIAVETTLVCPKENIDLLTPYIEEYIIDYKLQPQMYLKNSDYLQDIVSKLKTIWGKKRINRLVFVNGMEKYIDDICSALKRLGVEQLELLRCHNLAAKKYEQLGLSNEDFTACETTFNAFAQSLRQYGIGVNPLSV